MNQNASCASGDKVPAYHQEQTIFFLYSILHYYCKPCVKFPIRKLELIMKGKNHTITYLSVLKILVGKEGGIEEHNPSICWSFCKG